MSTSDWLQVAGVAGTLLGGGAVGYLIKYFLDKKQQFITKNAEVKRETYPDFVNLYVDLFNDATKPTAVNELREFYKKYVLYGSPKVIKVFSELLQYFYKNPSFDTRHQQRKTIRKMAKVFKAMRKDIGLSNRSLGADGEILLRAILKDYDFIMYPKWYLWLRSFGVAFFDELFYKWEGIEKPRQETQASAQPESGQPPTQIVNVKKIKKQRHKKRK